MDLQKERVKLRMKHYLVTLGRMFETDLLAKTNPRYRKDSFQPALQELIDEGFCERAMRGGRFIIVLTGEPLEQLMREGGSEL